MKRRALAGSSPRQAHRKETEALLAKARELGLITEERPATVRIFPVIYWEPNEARALLSTLVPNARYAVESGSLVALGSPNALDQVGELLSEIDLAADQVMMDTRLVEITPQADRETGLTWITRPSDHPGIIARPTEKIEERVNGKQIGKPRKQAESKIRIGSFAR